MKYKPRLLELDNVQVKVNQIAILFVMKKQGVTIDNFKEHHGWVHQGLNIPSKGLDKDYRCYKDDRIFYTWGRYEERESAKDAYPNVFLQVTVNEDLSCMVEEIKQGVYDTAFALYRQQEG